MQSWGFSLKKGKRKIKQPFKDFFVNSYIILLINTESKYLIKNTAYKYNE